MGCKGTSEVLTEATGKQCLTGLGEERSQSIAAYRVWISTILPQNRSLDLQKMK